MRQIGLLELQSESRRERETWKETGRRIDLYGNETEERKRKRERRKIWRMIDRKKLKETDKAGRNRRAKLEEGRRWRELKTL